MATPEEKAREQIDRQLEAAGWVVQGFQQINLAAWSGVGNVVSPSWALFQSAKNR